MYPHTSLVTREHCASLSRTLRCNLAFFASTPAMRCAQECSRRTTGAYWRSTASVRAVCSFN